VRSEEVQERALSRDVRAFATLQFDERRQFVVSPKFGGWIERLAVNATGDAVVRGQTLFEVYSPELNVLQQEWSLAGRSDDASGKLRNFDYPEAALEKLRRGERPRTIAIPSPVTGTVIEKMVVEGARFRAGETLFRIVDTSNMWVMAEVYEQDLAFVKVGDTAKVTVNAWPGQPFDGKITFIYPSVGKESRTARLRIEVANPDGRLRADMAATAEIMSPLDGSRLAVPDSAVIDSGQRQVVLVERGEGRYEPRPVKLGAHVPGWVQVLEGLKPGERVVTRATFLIDAESNIRAALAAFGAVAGKGDSK
jgi:Cu(I)/Ag(I) efflux system membrane fusion protein